MSPATTTTSGMGSNCLVLFFCLCNVIIMLKDNMAMTIAPGVIIKKIFKLPGKLSEENKHKPLVRNPVNRNLVLTDMFDIGIIDSRKHPF